VLQLAASAAPAMTTDATATTNPDFTQFITAPLFAFPDPRLPLSPALVSRRQAD
jgi:hypothetical protein